MYKLDRAPAPARSIQAFPQNARVPLAASINLLPSNDEVNTETNNAFRAPRVLFLLIPDKRESARGNKAGVGAGDFPNRSHARLYLFARVAIRAAV
jgi:hypothetical protein